MTSRMGGHFHCDVKLGLAGAAQDVDQLVADNFLDVGAGGLQVLTGIEVRGIGRVLRWNVPEKWIFRIK